MELKFRRKGEVHTEEGFDRIPEDLVPPEGLEGIDLTGYPVIFGEYGRHGDERAQEAHNSAPNCIVTYRYGWRNSLTIHGIILPDHFNPSCQGPKNWTVLYLKVRGFVSF